MKARIWNDSGWIKQTNSEVLKSTFDRILEECGFHVLDFVEYHFTPQGYTALWLLGESHFAVHTFPEFGKAYYEISSCNGAYFQRFLNLTDSMEFA